jgi:hypothetical protein
MPRTFTVLFLLLGFSREVLPGQAVPAPVQRYAYLVDLGGQVTKVDLAEGRVLYSRKVSDSTFETDSSATWEDRPLVEGAAVDETGPTLLLSLPDSGFSEERMRRRFRIVNLSLPDLRVLARFDIPLPQTRPAAVLTDRYRHRLLVHWEDTDKAGPGGWTYHISALSLPALKEVRRWVGFSRGDGGRPFPWFTHSSSQTIGADIALDGDSTRLLHPHGDIYFGADSFEGHWESRPPGSPQREAEIRRLLGIGPNDGMLVAWVTDTRGGMVLWSSVSDSGPRIQRLEVGRAGTGKPISAWMAPWGKASLLDAGRTVLLQELDGPMHGGIHLMRKNGRLTFYEAATGRQLGTVVVPELAGSYESVIPLCVSGDERYLLMRQGDGGIQIVEPALLRSRKLVTPDPVSTAAACFPSQR